MSTSADVSSPAPSAARSISRRNVALVNATELTGRSLLALPFLLSGVGKLGAYGATVAYMSSQGVPGGALGVGGRLTQFPGGTLATLNLISI
jgi:putative oxidoreductase